MVFKTFIAATLAAILAGGMVYVSTKPVSAGGAVSLATNETRTETSPEKTVIDRYLGGDKNDETSDAPENASSDVQDEYTSSDTTEIKPKHAESADPLPEKTIVNASETQRKNKPKLRRSSQPGNAIMANIKTVFEQAENINQVELRDRAYLDLSDYATKMGAFEQAKKAALKIEQVELRDTARSRIAMGMARLGEREAAFALIEEVEVSELKDVMRLQVIEALLAPQNTP